MKKNAPLNAANRESINVNITIDLSPEIIHLFKLLLSSPVTDYPSQDSENPRLKRLFLTDGLENRKRTEEERNRFLNYLADHHLSQRQVDCYKDNPINKAIVCFCIKWKRLKIIDKPSPAAVYRFLTETCHLTCAAEADAITASLGRLLRAEYDKETFDDVENYF